jgi:hypothetical protein
MADCRINVLDQRGNRALVRVTCASCKDENLLELIFQTDADAAAARRERDGGLDEGRPQGADPISADEVLELHELLAGHEGGFTELLARR